MLKKYYVCRSGTRKESFRGALNHHTGSKELVTREVAVSPNRLVINKIIRPQDRNELTLGVGAEARALDRSRLARSYSLFSLSSFTAASQISSELGFAWKARDRIPLAAGTSPETMEPLIMDKSVQVVQYNI